MSSHRPVKIDQVIWLVQSYHSSLCMKNISLLLQSSCSFKRYNEAATSTQLLLFLWLPQTFAYDRSSPTQIERVLLFISCSVWALRHYIQERCYKVLKHCLTTNWPWREEKQIQPWVKCCPLRLFLRFFFWDSKTMSLLPNSDITVATTALKNTRDRAFQGTFSAEGI